MVEYVPLTEEEIDLIEREKESLRGQSWEFAAKAHIWLDRLLAGLKAAREERDRLDGHLYASDAENGRLRKALEWLENNWSLINHYQDNAGDGMFWHYKREDGFLSKGHDNTLLATIEHAIQNGRALDPQPTEQGPAGV